MPTSDSTEPRVFQIYAEPETRRFGISYDLALSPLTAKFPGRATFAASLRPYGPTGEGVFRHALTQWYVREAAFAERRAKGKRGLPAGFIFAGGRPVQNADVMAALAEFGGGDMSVGFRAGERAKPFVNIKQFHFRLQREFTDKSTVKFLPGCLELNRTRK